ncbi:NAD(P)/FAD-dependent oxidoreductase [Calidifontibacter sp. DB0510]|uniref:NAD(P)/FAD-dependent oxidoreductase n=1 Tax=Metallococcus carri TaxID=1656884 RepID=A0A967AYI7_9MICO|nr:NAD(P)/FAD-dependent oxidoreductase [Metallococcus carri]NHN54170.1 NAD(P)/FAD-dependent oxidoreductase [Metallococcus carri]NOP36990.1 NAD(P)/FAD-dependent oxidoreductase [Calidifontibacter sp. DB2511S]
MTQPYDVVIVGGGHNGLTAAAYLARAGRRVLLLERSESLGGATVSAEAFPGMGARLSRYSYLVSLLPQRIVDDLGLDIRLARRRYSSYTPLPGSDRGLLIDNGDPAATRASFERVGAAGDAGAWPDFYARTHRLAQALWPTVTEPLRRRRDIDALVGDTGLTHDFVDRPLGEVIEASFTDDLVRGLVLTDGLISTFASPHEADLRQNICFLYHVIGGGTGDWDVPIGGMGQVSGELERVARQAGATLRAGTTVTGIDDGRVTVQTADDITTIDCRDILWAAAPAVLDELMDASFDRVEGAQVKVNLLLSRLPRLREDVDPAAAFGGTFHINETYSQLESAHARATAGGIPDPMPAEIYCHSLTDPSILSAELRASGAQTLTVFTLQTPDRLLDGTTESVRDELQRRVLDSLSSVLAEPIDDVIMTGRDGAPCIETRTTRDLQASLAMPGGNIFHAPLAWPWASDDEPLDTPAQRWGVATPYDGVLLAGAGSRRGGGVSGLGGYAAAQALLHP